MIAKMSKYDFVLYAAQSEDFIERLRELGLVDITTTGWEPSEEDRQLLLDIEGHAKAADFLRTFREEKERFKADAEPFSTGEEAYRHYAAASKQAAALNAEIARLEKSADELRPWGEFSVESLRRLSEQGIVLRYFSAPASAYDKYAAEWAEEYTLELIHRGESTAYFVVVAAPGQEVNLDAQEMKAPTMDIREAERRIALFLPDYLDAALYAQEEDYPLCAVRCTYRPEDRPTHRDFLGALMGCGIKRETVGDIYVSEGSCDFLVTREILPYLLQNFLSAGRTKLHVEQLPIDQIRVPEQKVKAVRDTVSSLRLDGVVSSGFSISRGKAADYIAAGKCELNYAPCMKGDKQAAEGDVITIRGLGKIRLETIGGSTKKGRIAIEITRFL